LFCQCSDRNPVYSTGDNKNNPAITGMLRNSDGSVCKNVNVKICAKNTLADTSNSAEKVFTTKTDNTGSYSFDATLEPDIYVIDAQNNRNAVRIDSVEIKKKNEDVSLGTATMKPVGAIRGKLQTRESNLVRISYILAFGTNRFTRTNVDGSFILDNLAEGTYSLRIIPNAADCGIIDTGNIEVVSAETTDIETIILPGNESLVPQNLKLVFDTMQQKVTLSWNRISDIRVKRYNIYRKDVGQNELYVNIFTSTDQNDTFFTDSLCYQDRTYEYSVASLTTNNQESQKSQGCTVTVSSYLTVDTIYNDFMGSNENIDFGYFTVSPQGDIYLPLTASEKIEIRSPTMALKGEFAAGIFQYQEILYNDGRIYLSQLNQNTWTNNLLVYSENGNFIDTTIKEINTMSFDVKFGLIATAFYTDTAGAGDSVCVYSINGELKKKWNYGHNYQCMKINFINDDKLLLLLHSRKPNTTKFVVYDLDGNKISEKEFPDNMIIQDIEYDSQKQFLFVAQYEFGTLPDYSAPTGWVYLSGRINVYDKNYSIVAHYNVIHGGLITDITLNDKGNLYIGVGSGAGVVSAGDRIIKLNPVNR
jgi:hypothetical protein